MKEFEKKVRRGIDRLKRERSNSRVEKMYNEELDNLYCSQNNIILIKSMWSMTEIRNAYQILVGKSEGRGPLRRPNLIWEDNFEMNLKKILYTDVEWINLAHDRV
jgi:hypothetical protein